MVEFVDWTHVDAAGRLHAPHRHDDKYTRGVLGVVAGSDAYPGAAVLTVEAAVRTGLGMLRYLGPNLATALVLQRRPEAVPGDGRVQAWLVGPGMDHADPHTLERIADPLASGLPAVLDGGALDSWRLATGAAVLTPHHGELARMLGVDRSAVAADPAGFAVRATELTGATVLLKGHETLVVGTDARLRVTGAPTWLATAGAGDVLAGILGALVATAGPAPHLASLAATAAFVHARAAHRASEGGPIAALDVAAAVPAVIADLLASEVC